MKAHAMPRPRPDRTSTLIASILLLVLLTACSSSTTQRPVEATETPTLGNFSRFTIPTPNVGPTFIARGKDSNLWFLETDFFGYRGNSIARISPQGQVTQFRIPTRGSSPFGLAVGPDGNVWFTEQSANKVGRITPNGDMTEFQLATLSSPRPITVGPDGNLWFVEHDKLGRITPTGNLKEFPLALENSPPAIDITTGSDGNLWISLGDKIARVTTSGKLTLFAGNTGFLAVGSDGNIWTFAPDKLWKIAPSGVFTAVATLPTGLVGNAITKGPDGNLWAALVPVDDDGRYHSGKCGLARITPNGELSVIPVPNDGCALRGITAGPDNRLWVTDWANNLIWSYRVG
jgi:streptogramin lyase